MNSDVSNRIIELDEAKQIIADLKKVDAYGKACFNNLVVTNYADQNRYADQQLYDRYAVQLLPFYADSREHLDVLFSSYIDASHIKLRSTTQDINEYISAAAPMKTTMGAFWKMIREKNVNVVVMLCNLIEEKREKADIYWEGEWDYIKIGESEDIQTKSKLGIIERHIPYYTKRTKGKTEKSMVHQIRYINWPDMGKPPNNDEFLRLLQLYAEARGTGQAVIHCSAGKGRTGVFIGLDFLKSQIDGGATEINIVQCIANMRKFRPGMVQTAEQLQFMYTWIQWYVEKIVNKIVVIVDNTSNYAKRLCDKNGWMCLCCNYVSPIVFERSYRTVMKLLENTLPKDKHIRRKVNAECWARFRDDMYCLITIQEGVVRCRPVEHVLDKFPEDRKYYNDKQQILEAISEFWTTPETKKFTTEIDDMSDTSDGVVLSDDETRPTYLSDSEDTTNDNNKSDSHGGNNKDMSADTTEFGTPKTTKKQWEKEPPGSPSNQDSTEGAGSDSETEEEPPGSPSNQNSAGESGTDHEDPPMQLEKKTEGKMDNPEKKWKRKVAKRMAIAKQSFKDAKKSFGKGLAKIKDVKESFGKGLTKIKDVKESFGKGLIKIKGKMKSNKSARH